MRFDYPFLFNNSRKDNKEVETFENILIEAVYLNGQDIYYIQRKLLNEVSGFEEFKTKISEKAQALRVYVEEVEGFAGPGNMFTKFGLQLNDEMTVYAPKKLFQHFNIIPKEQDLIYHVVSDRLFEITYVTDYNIPGVNFPLGKNYAYKLECKLFIFDYDDIVPQEVATQEYDNFPTFPKLEDLFDLNDEDIERNNKEIEDEEKELNIVDNSEKNPLLGE